MITVRYFASIREKLNCAEETLQLPTSVNSVEDLVNHLVQVHGALWAETLQSASVLVAINQTVEKKNALIKDGDELAFFPPVTGG
jgi:molybdopterin synthase sulfur carrier subunit